AKKAVEYVRGRKGPYFLELKTYRFRGHSMSDSNAYRDKTEEETWKKRDPLNILYERLIQEKILTADEYAAMDQEIMNFIDHEVVAFANESPEPVPEDLEKYVLA
ncbi:MAG TPA: thiamine pyrophosphate-dependent enzyme, partial [Burkholderiales bacterium]|nr:thiamine pyrophosphate-dependent enzyme [Burkholderiales bacterium]